MKNAVHVQDGKTTTGLMFFVARATGSILTDSTVTHSNSCELK